MVENEQREQLIVVGARFDLSGIVVEGSKVFICQECHLETWAAPSAQRLLDRGAGIICLECFEKLDVQEDEIEPVTDEQRREYQEATGFEFTGEAKDLLRHIRRPKGGS